MIIVTIQDNFIDDEACLERGITIETDCAYSPDVAHDLARRAVETWATQRSFLEETISDE